MRSGALLLIFAALAAPRPAAAQLCHLGPLDADVHVEHEHGDHHHGPPPHHVEAEVTVDGGLLDGAAYQGVQPSLSWHRGRFGAYVAAPVYRLAPDAGDAVYGPGDPLLQAHARLLGGRTRRAGVLAAVVLPLGSADDGLGMGHVMAMPGVWATARAGRASGLVSASLGKSLGGDDAHAHHMHGPMIDPMNPFEVGGAARGAVALTSSLEVHALALAAAPIGDGVFRAAAGGGSTYRAGAWDVTGEAQVGLAGDPFRVRALLSLGHTF